MIQRSRNVLTRLAAGWPALDPASAWNGQKAVLAASREELLRAFAGRRRDIEQAGGRANLQRHLGSFALDGAGIRGIGRQRLQTLQAHGISTAADISATALRSVPGIGPVLKTALEAWRASKQRTFRPGVGDRRPLPAADVRRIDARYADAIGKHLGVLRGGVDKLRRVAADGEVSLEQARVALLHAAQALAQAEADLGGPL